MSKIKIKSESLPERCEICHQSDNFDPVKGQCKRCQDITIESLKLCRTVEDIESRRERFQENFTAFSMLISMSLALYFCSSYFNKTSFEINNFLILNIKKFFSRSINWDLIEVIQLIEAVIC